MNAKIRIDLATGLYLGQVHPLEVGEDIIETPCLIPYRLPKWENGQWIEGATDFPIAQVQEPTLEERLQALEEMELERMFEL